MSGAEVGAYGGALIAAIGAVLAFGQFGLRLLYGYTLTPTRFEVRLFGRIPLYGIPFVEMSAARPWRFSLAQIGRSLVTLSFGNRIFGRALVIERVGRFPRYVVVTPEDASSTLVELNARIARERETH